MRRRQWHPTPVLLPGKSYGWRSLVGCSPWNAKSLTRLSGFTFTFHFHALEKEMTTRSSVLAWRIPGTGEPCGLPSMGSHRVGHDWSDLAECCMIPFVFILSSNPSNMCDFLNATGFILFLKLLFNIPYLWKIFRSLHLSNLCFFSLYMC